MLKKIIEDLIIDIKLEIVTFINSDIIKYIVTINIIIANTIIIFIENAFNLILLIFIFKLIINKFNDIFFPEYNIVIVIKFYFLYNI